MIAALVTSFLFALSAIFARRATLAVGSQRANFARLMSALVLLGLWAHTVGEGLHGASLGILVISGVVGFGVDDWALFEALPRLGAALSVLLCQCLAVPMAALTEWLWLGTRMTSLEIGSSAVILLGVGLAMSPERDSEIPAGHRLAGTIYGILAAAGQAGGAVLSRVAFHRAAETGFSLDGLTAAYQRLWGGVLCLAALLVARHLTRRWHSPGVDSFRPDWKRGRFGVIGTAIAGPTLGVGCYQWALKGTPSAVVLPIIATTPLIVMAIAFLFEGIRPGGRAIVGAGLAVGGVALLIWGS